MDPDTVSIIGIFHDFMSAVPVPREWWVDISRVVRLALLGYIEGAHPTTNEPHFLRMQVGLVVVAQTREWWAVPTLLQMSRADAPIFTQIMQSQNL